MEDMRRYKKKNKGSDRSRLVKEMKNSMLGMSLVNIRKEKDFYKAYLQLFVSVTSEVSYMLDAILPKN